VRSLPEFLLVALLVTLTPGPATATIVRVAARDGRTAAQRTILGNSAGVFIWGALSAFGVSSLVLASKVAFDVLRLTGALVLMALGARSLLAHRSDEAGPGAGTGTTTTTAATGRPGRSGWQAGFTTSLSNPKLAVFFVALFPQFLVRGTPVFPYAMAMAAAIVTLDIIWYSALSFAVDRARGLLQPRVQRRLERGTGAVMIALGARLAVQAR
jgi:threonine/homoserine/homoserine lactone efflux protein